MHYLPHNESLVVLTIDVVLYKYRISEAGRMTQERKVKLSIKGDGSDLKCVIAGTNLLAAANHESLLRLWHLERDDSYILSLAHPLHMAPPKDTLLCVGFNPATSVLAGATATGRVCMWKFHGPTIMGSASSSSSPFSLSSYDPSEHDWEVLPPVQIESHDAIHSLCWGPSPNLLTLNCRSACSILNETVLHCRYVEGNALVQRSAEQVMLQIGEHGKPTKIQSALRVKGVDMNEKYVLLWNGKRAEVRELSKDERALSTSIYSSFATRASILALHHDTIYAAVGGRIEVCNLQGVVKQVLAFAENEGVPTHMHINDSYLAVLTSANLLKMWDISRATPRSIVPGRAFLDHRVMRHVRVNANGKHVCILANRVVGAGTSSGGGGGAAGTGGVVGASGSSSQLLQVADTKCYVYDVDSDKFLEYEFGPRYTPVNQHWDAHDAKLMAVETKKLADAAVKLSPLNNATATSTTTTTTNSTNSTTTNNTTAAGKDAKDDEKKVDDIAPSLLPLDPEYAEGDIASSSPAASSASSSSTSSSLSSALGGFPLGEVLTLFVTSDDGILMQDSFGIDPSAETLVNVGVPYLFFMGRPTEVEGGTSTTGTVMASASSSSSTSSSVMMSESGGVRLRRQTMRDFVGLEKVNEETRRDLQAFSFHLTIGNLDEAYRAVKKISSDSIWENMAAMCVKTKRLDVAEVCFGNMNNARGAQALRLAKHEPEKEVAIAMVAIQLNKLDDAERLYRECGRFDLLVKLYIAAGRWKDALRLCAQHDRIHLKNTHYLYARHLESIGDTSNAIKNYEKSGTHRHEVPRMLFDSQHMSELEGYIKSTDDKSLIKWWAQYCESNNAYDEAIRYYERAKETLALVRVYCYRGEEQRAADLCLSTNDPSACYHLARQYESQDKIKEAIAFYTRARRLNHGIRLAKEHGLDNELLQLAIESSATLKAEAAAYFEGKSMFDKAVLLYEKSGKVARALDLCFRAQLFDSLRTIADGLGADTPPALLAKCADFFLSHQQFDKAVHLFITAQQYNKALQLCLKQNVKITEAMAEKMSPPKGRTEEEKVEREEILKKLAHLCKDQGSYHLACKKYTQAGDHIRAIKCLLKSSDTEKIIYYANMTKKKEIYILAANYLQNLDWHSDANIMSTIINFYTKAKALQQLSTFYDACAQVEIDEYRDYEKALGALKESMKNLIKSRSSTESGGSGSSGAAGGGGKDDKLNALNARIQIVERFVEARKLVKTAPEQMVEMARSLLDTAAVDTALRVGDVYALLVEYFYSVRNFSEAYAVIERMRGAQIVLSPYLEQGMVQAIHNAVGAEMQAEQEHTDDGIGEDIHADA